MIIGHFGCLYTVIYIVDVGTEFSCRKLLNFFLIFQPVLFLEGLYMKRQKKFYETEEQPKVECYKENVTQCIRKLISSALNFQQEGVQVTVISEVFWGNILSIWEMVIFLK